MNIKNLFGLGSLISPLKSVSKADRQIKSEASQDSDANGQQLYEKQKKKNKMSDEQFAKALELLKEKSFIKDMHWVVSSFIENEIKYAWIQDQSGNTIRKIIEYELWEVFDQSAQEPTKGQLLKKTA